MVLLDTLHRHHSRDLVVAHVDHGIRTDSANDARFVRDLAARYKLPYESVQLGLGADASEDTARRARYAFLRALAGRYGGPIVTAHHADDVVETIAINLLRGTGWRGLAVFGAPDVYRPLTVWFKHEIIDYARRHDLAWREDSTNQSSAYLRNRLRRQTAQLPLATKLELLALWRHQDALKHHIVRETARHTSLRRYPYIMLPPDVALEVLAHTLDVPLTRPQLMRALIAIKTARAGSRYHLSKHDMLVFSADEFQLITRKK